MKNTINLEMNTSIRKESAKHLGLHIMSRDINNNEFMFRVKDGVNEDLELNENYEVEVLSVFTNAKSKVVTRAEVIGKFAFWSFDTQYITGDDIVYNYVYIKKSGVPVVSSDANAFYFTVGLSKIDDGAGDVAKHYDANYEKVLHEFEVAINLTKDEWAQMANETRNFVDEIKDVTVDEFVELKMGEELANLEVNYATRLTGLETNDNALTAQLARTDGAIDTINNIKVDKGGAGQISWGMLDQNAREQAGGNTAPAIVGVDSVSTPNVVNNSMTTQKRTVLGELGHILCPVPVEFDLTLKTMKIPYVVASGSNQILWRDKIVTLPGSDVVIDIGTTSSGFVKIMYNILTNTFKVFNNSLMASEPNIENFVYIATAFFNQKMVVTHNNFVITDNGMSNITENMPNVSFITSLSPVEVDFSTKKIKFPSQSVVSWGQGYYILPSAATLDFSTYGSNFGHLYFDSATNGFFIFGSTQISKASKGQKFIGTLRIAEEKIQLLADYVIVGKPDEADGKNIYKYPDYPVWGHEYMINWYKMILAESDLIMSFAGDSTTHGAGVVSEPFKRHNIAKKIMVKGGYDATKITTLNKGHEATHTGNWLRNDMYPQRVGIDPIPQYGYLHEDMQANPNLYVIGHGINDGSSKHWEGTTLQQRIEGFESRLREGLGRIRTANTYPSGPSYGRGPDDLTIILTMPNSTYRNDNGVKTEIWHDAIRPIAQKAARDFKCGFVDISQRQYDHEFSNSWSSSDFIHPIDATNGDYMSLFNDILYPIGLQK